jgi:uncharacterized membrane-anchored protein
LARGNLFQLLTHDYGRQKRKKDEITKESNISVVLVIVAIIIRWLLLVSFAGLIIVRISDFTPILGASQLPALAAEIWLFIVKFPVRA